MAFLLLLLVAICAGLCAALVARLYERRAGATVLGAAREAGSRAGDSAAAREARRHPEEATALGLVAGLAAVLIGGLTVAALAVLVRETDVLAGLDTSAANWGDGHVEGWTRDAITAVTDLGDTWTVVILAVVVAAVEIARTRNRWVVPFLVAVMLGNKLLTELLKHLIDRARPALEPVAATLGPSFPSGHSSTAAASYAAFALVAGRWLGPRAWPALAGAAVGIAVAVAGSRVLLDVHWATDVLAGLALGWAWFAVCAVAFGGHALRFGAPARVAGRGAAQAGAPPG